MLSTEPTAGNHERGGPWISVVNELQRRWYPIRKANYRIRTRVIRTFRDIVLALCVTRIRQSSGQSLFFTFLSFVCLLDSIAL